MLHKMVFPGKYIQGAGAVGEYLASQVVWSRG